MTRQALEGLKVVDFCWAVAGPLVGLCLAQHGATVIRVESMRRVDLSRVCMPYKDNKPGVNRSGFYTLYNNSKLGMSVDFSNPKGVEIAKRLVAWSDIAGENFAPGIMAKWGLNYDELKKVKPDIIMYLSSNLGQTGPEASQPGYGNHLVGYSGLTHLTGWPDRPPTQPYGPYTDYIGGRFWVAAIMAAVEYRRRTGKGQYLDLAQLEISVHHIAPVVMDYTVNQRIETRDGNQCAYAAPHCVYPCRGDDRWCAIGVFLDEEWNAMCRAMGDPEWAKEERFSTLLERKKNEIEPDKRVGDWTRNLTAEDVEEKLQAVGVPAGVVENAADIVADPQLVHRSYFRQSKHPEIGWQNYETAGFVLSKTPTEITAPAPLIGPHTQFGMPGNTRDERSGVC